MIPNPNNTHHTNNNIVNVHVLQPNAPAESSHTSVSVTNMLEGTHVTNNQQNYHTTNMLDTNNTQFEYMSKFKISGVKKTKKIKRKYEMKNRDSTSSNASDKQIEQVAYAFMENQMLNPIDLDKQKNSFFNFTKEQHVSIIRLDASMIGKKGKRSVDSITDGEMIRLLHLTQQQACNVLGCSLSTLKRKLKRELHSMEIAYQEEIKGLKTNQDKNLTKQTETFARKLKETQLKYEMKMKKLREDLELRGRKETEEIEERKNTHIKQLMEKHKLAFQQMKDYYITITRNNLELIKTLKDEAALMKQEEADNEKLMLEIAQDNKRLSEPLVKALAEVKKLRNELANYQKDKLSLKNAKSRLVMMEDQLKKLKWEHEILEQSHKQVHRERDDLYDKFEKTIHEVQQKTLFKNQVLETKVYALQETLEKKDAQIHEILKACNIDEHTAEEISEGLDNVIEEKNNTIRELKFEIEKMKKSYNDLIRVINSKMQQYGIEDELGIEPIANVVDEGVPGRVWVK